jgi:hypothetical protein
MTNENWRERGLSQSAAGGQPEMRSEKSHADRFGEALRVGTTRGPGKGGAAGTEAKAQCSISERGVTDLQSHAYALKAGGRADGFHRPFRARTLERRLQIPA